MKNLFTIILVVLVGNAAFAQDRLKKIRITGDLEIVPLSKNAYMHVSWITMAPYGRMVFKNISRCFGQSGYSKSFS